MDFHVRTELSGMRDEEKVVGNRRDEAGEPARRGEIIYDEEREEEDELPALSEARLCVNVWLAFGRQP